MRLGGDRACRRESRGNLKRIHINLKIKDKSRFDFSVEYLLEYRFEKSEVGALGRVEGASLPELCLQELTGHARLGRRVIAAAIQYWRAA